MPIKWGLVGFNAYRFPGKALENRLLAKFAPIYMRCKCVIIIHIALHNVTLPTLNLFVIFIK